MQELQSPGAGLPALERVLVNSVFKLSCFLTSDERALSQFERELDTLLAIVNSADLDGVCEQVLISRITGIEDSSRNWSLLMVLEHLCMVNSDILKVIDALNREIIPKGEVAIEYYKPIADLDVEVIDRFKDNAYDFLEVVRAHGKLKSNLTYAHPWFGMLNAHGWNVLAAAHMRIHRKQAQAIVAKRGVI